jgi:hypothetical protein
MIRAGLAESAQTNRSRASSKLQDAKPEDGTIEFGLPAFHGYNGIRGVRFLEAQRDLHGSLTEEARSENDAEKRMTVSLETVERLIEID